MTALEPAGHDLERRSHMLTAALERIGYRLLAAEVDVDAGRARVEVRRHDGYLLTLDVQHGRASITREWVRETDVPVGRRGDRFRARRLSTEFVGRTRIELGPRGALRAFADMIGDNSQAGRLEARDAIRLLLAAPGSR